MVVSPGPHGSSDVPQAIRKLYTLIWQVLGCEPVPCRRHQFIILCITSECARVEATRRYGQLQAGDMALAGFPNETFAVRFTIMALQWRGGSRKETGGFLALGIVWPASNRGSPCKSLGKSPSLEHTPAVPWTSLNISDSPILPKIGGRRPAALNPLPLSLDWWAPSEATVTRFYLLA